MMCSHLFLFEEDYTIDVPTETTHPNVRGEGYEESRDPSMSVCVYIFLL